MLLLLNFVFCLFFFINPSSPEMSAFSISTFFPVKYKSTYFFSDIFVLFLLMASSFPTLPPFLAPLSYSSLTFPLSFTPLRVPLLIHDSLAIPFTLHPSCPSFFCMLPAVLGMRPRCPQHPHWTTSHPRRVVLGPSSDSRASSSPWPPGPLRRPTTPLPPPRAWGSYTAAPGAAGGSGGVQGRGQGAAQPHPGHHAIERAQGHGPAPTRAAGIIWWGKFAPGAWMSNHFCKYMT